MDDSVTLLKRTGSCERLIEGDVEYHPSIFLSQWTELDGTGGKIRIEEGAVICPGVKVYTHSAEERVQYGREDYRGDVIIGRYAFLGTHCVVEPNVVIGDYARVGALSFVRRGSRIGVRETWAGCPAVYRCTRSPEGIVIK